MIDWRAYDRRRDEVKERADRPACPESRCRVIGCGRPVRAGTSDGLDTRFCRSHAEQHRRHGSPYRKSYRAVEVNPNRRAALQWLAAHESDRWVRNAVERVEALYESSGPHVEAFRLRGLSARERAWAAWARLRKAEVDARLPLTAWLAVEILIAEDPHADHHKEFKRVQAAKIVHRMASGTHKRWQREIPAERNRFANKPIRYVEELHVYPRSRGQILRHIGADLEAAAELLAEHLSAIRTFKHEQDTAGGLSGRAHPTGIITRKRMKR